MGYYDKEQQVFYIASKKWYSWLEILCSSYSNVVWLIHANGLNVKTYFVILPISVLDIFSFEWIRVTISNILTYTNHIEIIMRMIILISKLIIILAIVLSDEVFETFSHHAFMEIWEMMFTTFLFIIYLTFY